MTGSAVFRPAKDGGLVCCTVQILHMEGVGIPVEKLKKVGKGFAFEDWRRRNKGLVSGQLLLRFEN